MLAVSINDARLGRRVGIDEEAVFIGIIARAFQVAVTERRFDGFESRYSAAIALELAFAFFVSSLDGSADFSTVFVSDLGMIRLTLYFGVPPLMDFGSQTLA